MMKRFSLLCLISTSLIAAPTTLIFDLGGIVVKHAWWRYVGRLGITNVISYMWKDGKLPWKLSGDMQKSIFEVLESIPLEQEEGFLRACTSHGVTFPYILCAYQAGRIDSVTARERSHHALKQFQDEGRISLAEGELVARSIDAMFDPDWDAGCNIPLPQGMKIVKELAGQLNPDGSKKYTLIALTNWEPIAFSKVRQRLDGLDYFDDIITSGEAGTVKPNAGAWDYVIKKHNLSLDDCIFVDDQRENVEAARACGIKHSLLFTDYTKLRKQLVELEILSLKPVRKWFF